ncbi:MAG: phosphoadenosine phosphosulfate reductase family protein [Magnetococcales bacterium]|nr:phosphoadenosine phosphosulfate reductase family protein [Magnetococcales bacterium]
MMNENEIRTAGVEAKVILAKVKIMEWIKYWKGQVYVSYSGGMDSTVLLDIARQVEPGIPGVFCDSGQEYPEIREFVRETENIEWIRPEKNFRSVLIECGLPLVSKRVSKQVRILQEKKPGTEATQILYTTGTNSDGEYSRRSRIPHRWRFLVDSDIRVSEKCCEHLKKDPFRAYERRTGRMPMIGIRKDEGGERSLQRVECNTFSPRYGRSAPLLHWTNEDIWNYVHETGLKYCCLYDRGEHRTGCMFCGFGAHLEQKYGHNRFERMAKSHPKQWRYFMEKLGMKEKFDAVGVRTGTVIE